MILKIIAIGIVTVFLSLILKQYKPEFSLLVSLCGGLLIFILIIDAANEILDQIILINVNSDVNFIEPIIKILGVGYITEFTASLAEDSGNKSIATKVVLGGKIAICLLALPIIKKLINAIFLLV